MIEYIIVGLMILFFGIIIIGSISWMILIPVIIWKLLKKLFNK